MKLNYRDSINQGEFHLTMQEKTFDRLIFQCDRKDKFLTIAWNNGPKQKVTIDEVDYVFPEKNILPLMVNQAGRTSNMRFGCNIA